MSVSRASRLWMVVFGAWGLFVSGAFAGVVGAPGAWQAWRLHEHLTQKDAQVAALEEEIQDLASDVKSLETNRAVQLREIRRVLGYARADEWIFDFTDPNDLRAR